MFRTIGMTIVGCGILLTAFLATYAATAGCPYSGPQTPRDIVSKEGANAIRFSVAPPAEQMNLCNIHFHKNAEHKGPQFSLSGGTGEYGGWKCNEDFQRQQKAEALAPMGGISNGCSNIQPGDTIEVHWVFSTCNVQPGADLSACVSPACANPQLRVEAAVYLLVNNDQAIDFGQFDYHNPKDQGVHQPMQLPSATGALEFLGSTTGPKYTNQSCSPYQVAWSVRPQCRTLNINTLHTWCQKNVFKEQHAHGVRQLITDVNLLSPIR